MSHCRDRAPSRPHACPAPSSKVPFAQAVSAHLSQSVSTQNTSLGTGTLTALCACLWVLAGAMRVEVGEDQIEP